ncbi:MAG: hypothetical protein EHM47_10170 [Ignavibacteriales bacterium]|nr:MAG: hypothetical protein EHM47_10170 [Ignavibacteriales bacterium]
MKKFIPLFIGLLFISSCSREDGGDPPPGSVSGGIFILNEGLFGQNNSSLTFYNPETGDVINDVYRNANSNTSMGDNANHMFIFDDQGYIAVNGSNKVEVIDLQTFVSQGFINLGQGASPREVFINDSASGYVTSHLGEVIKFNPETKSVLSSVFVDSKPEGIAESGGKLFVANSWFGDTLNISNTISVIDIPTDIEILRIQVGINPTKVLSGPDGLIYVLSTGSYTDPNIFSGVYIIDPFTHLLVDSIAVTGNPFEACFINNDRMLVVNSAGVMDVNLLNRTVSAQPLIPTSTVTTFQFGLIYSVAYDDIRQVILCGNPKDFQQNGEVVLFDLNGTEIRRINVGINPGTIILNF